MKKYSAKEIVNTPWIWEEGSYNSNENISLASQLLIAKSLSRIADTLEGIRSNQLYLEKENLRLNKAVKRLREKLKTKA